MKYAHDFMVVILSSFLNDSCFIIAHVFRVISLALRQSYDRLSASELTLNDMGKTDWYKMRNKAQAVCINVGTYCTMYAYLYHSKIHNKNRNNFMETMRKYHFYEIITLSLRHISAGW